MTQDVLTLLTQDHQAAEALLQGFDDTVPADRAEYFCEVAHTLVGHEVAEELVVYPALRAGSEKSEEITEARLGEQAQVEQTLAELEDLDPQSGAFTNKFKKLRDAVVAHAKAEESTAFPLLKQATTAQQRKELGDRYQKAHDTAPTHPHPHAPDTPPGNKIAGPIAALFDRTRDAVHRI
ncbi:MAG: hemerythrin domain-containing protein [Acidimicrobiales bacterium]